MDSTRRTPPPTSPRSRRWNARRILRRAGGIVVWGALATAGLALLVALVLALPAGRQLLARAAFDLADRELPGELSVQAVRWPRFGELSVAGLLWTADADTLAAIEDLRIAVSVSDLRRRDLTIDHLQIKDVTADLPAIEDRLAAAGAWNAAAAAPPPEPPAGTTPFLRPGALPFAPSLALRHGVIARVALRLSPVHTAHLDSLDLALELRRGHRPQLAAGLRARPLSTLGLSWRVRGTAAADTIDLALSPLRLASPSRLPAERDLPLAGRLRVPLATVDSLLAGKFAWPSLALDGLQIDGDAGTWRLDAHSDGLGPGRVVLRSEMPEAPVALLAGLAALGGGTTVTSASLAALAARWSEHGPPFVDLTLDLEPPPPGQPLSLAKLGARGQLRLPAPAAVAPLLPPQLHVADLGPLELDLAAGYDGTAEPPALFVDLDLGRTAWLQQARLRAAGSRAAVDRAEFALRFAGLEISLAGGADQDGLRADLVFALPDAALLRRWQDPALADLALAARGALSVRGPWRGPRATAQANVALSTAGFAVPELVLAATIAPDTVALQIGLPGGLQLPAADLAGLEVAGLDLVFDATVNDEWRHLDGVLGFSVQAPPAALNLRGRCQLRDLASAPAIVLTAEHLRVSVDRHHLTSTRPWHAAFSAADTTARLSGLQLAGDLGSVELDASANPDSLAAALALDLRVLLDAVRPLLPADAQARLPAGTLNVTGRATAAGLRRAPWAGAALALAILDSPDLAGLGADLALSLGGLGSLPAQPDPSGLGWQAGNARAACRLRDLASELAVISARIPWPLAGATVPDSLDLRLSIPALDLGRLAPLLPPDHGVAGALSALARVHGLLPADVVGLVQRGELDPRRDLDLALAGEIKLTDVALQTSAGSVLTLDGAVDLVGTSRQPMAAASLELGGDLGRVELRAQASADSVALVADLGLALDSEVARPYLPLGQQALLPRGALAVDGRVQASGPFAAPWAAADLRLAVVDQPDLSALATDIALLIGGRGPVPADLADERRRWRPQSVRLDLRLLDAGSQLLRISALAPLPHLAAAADSVEMRLDAPGLDLARLAPLLPAGVSLTGRLEAATRVWGEMAPGQVDADLNLAGRLRAADLRAQLPEGSRLAVRGRVDLDGTTLAPLIRGGLYVEGGLIRLPDPPPVLLPATGDASLWRSEAIGASGTPPDAVAAETAAPAAAASLATPAGPPAAVVASEPAGAGPLPRVLPDLVLTLTSPGGLWLRGQGLDVELAGDLSLLLRDDRIALEGELQAVQGTMRQLGHLFRLERGRVAFDGSETELDPELDLVLGVRVGTYRIGIELGGTATSPSLRFTSEPELSEADILATLLFGKPLDELDEGQTGLLASRAAQLAAAYGSARLQASLARQLGVDVVSVAPREGDEETTALTVGKYLSPRVMVRYEQLLREGSAFFVHLDYAFAGAFRLHTQISQGEESGVQLKWQRDW